MGIYTHTDPNLVSEVRIKKTCFLVLIGEIFLLAGDAAIPNLLRLFADHL